MLIVKLWGVLSQLEKLRSTLQDLWTRSSSWVPLTSDIGFWLWLLQGNDNKWERNIYEVGCLEITRCHLGGFGWNLGENLPTSLPELPVQLRDLRHNQKCLKTYFCMSLTKNKNLDCWAWISASRPLESVLGRNVQVESEVWVDFYFIVELQGR